MFNIKLILKIAGATIITIFLGALGSGVWEKLLSPGIDSFVAWWVSFVGSVFAGYYDVIYIRASRGINDFYLMKISTGLMFMNLIVLVAISQIMYVINFGRKKFARKYLRFFIIGNFFALLILGLTFPSTQYSLNLRAFTHDSFNILRPYIGKKEFFKLNSDFLQIKGANDYKSIYESITNHAKEHSIQLPDFAPVGIELPPQ